MREGSLSPSSLPLFFVSPFHFFFSLRFVLGQAPVDTYIRTLPILLEVYSNICLLCLAKVPLSLCHWTHSPNIQIENTIKYIFFINIPSLSLPGYHISNPHGMSVIYATKEQHKVIFVYVVVQHSTLNPFPKYFQVSKSMTAMLL